MLEAEMDNHAEGQELGKTRAISKLDWPTQEMLAAAHRARGEFLRELVVALVRRLKARITEHAPVGRPAKVRVAARR
jgi:hypothetical protein